MGEKVCERCGKKYEEDDQDMFFEPPYPLMVYESIARDFCGECASEAAMSLEDGIFEEACEVCGAKFDPITEVVRFDGWDKRFEDVQLWEVADDMGKIVCGSCALDYLNSKPDPGDDGDW